MSELALSIVIPTFNRRELLDLTLRALLLTKADASAYEIIVVDDGSTDGTGEWLQREFPHIAYVWRSKNIGKPNNPGLARNCGIRVAQGKWLAFMDSDILHCHDIIHATVKQVTKPALWRAKGDWIMKREYNYATEIETKVGRDEAMPGQFWWVAERALIVKLGGFDERFTDYGAEDQDLMARIWRCQMPIEYITGQYGVGFYASRGLTATGGVLNKEQNIRQHEIRKTDMSVVRNQGVAWGEPHDPE